MDRFGREEFDAAAAAVKALTRQQPRVGIVLGSGLGEFAASVENADVIPYQEISHCLGSLAHCLQTAERLEQFAPPLGSKPWNLFQRV